MERPPAIYRCEKVGQLLIYKMIRWHSGRISQGMIIERLRSCVSVPVTAQNWGHARKCKRVSVHLNKSSKFHAMTPSFFLFWFNQISLCVAVCTQSLMLWNNIPDIFIYLHLDCALNNNPKRAMVSLDEQTARQASDYTLVGGITKTPFCNGVCNSATSLLMISWMSCVWQPKHNWLG